MLKLNLGCGVNKKPDYVNVDREGVFTGSDVMHDLEQFPWPWEANSVSEIRMVHVLEHLGQDPNTYRRIWQEIYRICAPGAKLHIVVPHWRHDNFWSDPTHVRAVTPLGICLLSQKFNRTCEKAQAANSPLGLYWGVDFEVSALTYVPGKAWYALHPGEVDDALLMSEIEIHCNLVEELVFDVRVVKCWPAMRAD